jgi:hypothetical protein
MATGQTQAPKNQDNATDTKADTKAQQQPPHTHPRPLRQGTANLCADHPEATRRLMRHADWR